MLRDSCTQDKQEIFDLWKQAYPMQNEEYLQFYFDYVYDQGVGIVYEMDGRIVSSLEMNYHTLYVQGKQLKASYILGASTLPDYRRRGYMQTLMESALDEARHNCLITLIKAFNPKAYQTFGFEVVYHRKAYTLTKATLHTVSSAHVSSQANAKELLHVYRKFVQRFDGYYVRDIPYYETLLKELQLGQKQLLVYRDAHGEVSGYVIYQKRKQERIVQEAIYLESVVLKRLLKKTIGDHHEITVMVSTCERLEKIFPMAIPKKQPYIMARINNFELFNKLYNTKIKTVEQAFSLSKKPLWCHEYY